MALTLKLKVDRLQSLFEPQFFLKEAAAEQRFPVALFRHPLGTSNGGVLVIQN